jgi:MFS family permease
MLQRVVDDGGAPAPLGPLGLIRRNGRITRLAAAVLISSIGDPLSQTVSLVLLYQATRSPLAIAAAYGVEMVGVLTIGGFIGAAADRTDRRRLIVRLEAVRFLVVAGLPVVTAVSVLLLYPLLFLLAGIESLVQPCRQAALPELVSVEEIGAATALLMTSVTLAQAAGFAIAGIALAHISDPRNLYIVDAFTFAAAAVIVATLGNIGGGTVTTRLRGGLRRAWSVPGARSLLVVAAATVFYVGMLNPSLLPAAYALSTNGPTAYTVLEVCLILGGLLGSLVAGRIKQKRRLAAQAASLWVFAAGVFSVGMSPIFLVAGLAVAISGVGNALYSVTNNSALMDAAVSSNRGTVMSARFTVTRATMSLGLATGAAATGWLGPLRAFSSFGVGLFVVAAAYTAFLIMQTRARHDSKGRHRGLFSRDAGAGGAGEEQT